MRNSPEREMLLRLAGQERVVLEDTEKLKPLLEQGLIEPEAVSPRLDLQARYEAQQERHRSLLEAKNLAEALHQRSAPRSGLGRWIPGSTPQPLNPEDPQIQALFALLGSLGIQVRDCLQPADIPTRLERIREHLHLEDRDCLDRLGSIDRSLNALDKRVSDSILVEGFGPVVLTDVGRRMLPEAPVLQEVEAVFNLISGPRRQKIEDFAHFREDPATLLACVLDNASRMERIADVVSTFEAIAVSLDRTAAYREIPDLRHRNAFLIRLLRCFKDQPDKAHLWCGRERLQALGARVVAQFPPERHKRGEHLGLAVDLLLVGLQHLEPEALAQKQEERLRLFQLIQSKLAAHPDLRPTEAAFGRLALAMLHAALARNAAGPVLAAALVPRMLEGALSAMKAAPAELGDPLSRICFGFHLAHWADFQPQREPGVLRLYRSIEAAFAPEGRQLRTPVQVMLHALATLQRLHGQGAMLSPEEYAGTLHRIRLFLRGHKDLARAFQTDSVQANDEIFLAANLAARAYFLQEEGLFETPSMRDVGVAGTYETLDLPQAPLLGQGFGTLMLE